MRRLPLIALLVLLSPSAVVAQPPSAGVAQPPSAVRALETLRHLDAGVVLADGRTVPLRELLPEGKPAVVEFWATWCAPCRKMTPRMRALYEEWGGERLSVVALTIEDPARAAEKVARYVDAEKLAYAVGFAPDGAYEAITGKSERSVPKVFVFDAQGRLVKSIESYTPWTMRQIESAVAKTMRH